MLSEIFVGIIDITAGDLTKFLRCYIRIYINRVLKEDNQKLYQFDQCAEVMISNIYL